MLQNHCYISPQITKRKHRKNHKPATFSCFRLGTECWNGKNLTGHWCNRKMCDASHKLSVDCGWFAEKHLKKVDDEYFSLSKSANTDMLHLAMGNIRKMLRCGG